MDSMPRLVVLRLVNGVVLDHPFAAEVRFPLWAATLDVDASDPFGWRRSARGPWRRVGGGGFRRCCISVMLSSSARITIRCSVGSAGTRTMPGTGSSSRDRSHRRATLRWMPSRPAASSSVGRCSTISDLGCRPQRRSADGPTGSRHLARRAGHVSRWRGLSPRSGRGDSRRRISSRSETGPLWWWVVGRGRR